MQPLPASSAFTLDAVIANGLASLFILLAALILRVAVLRWLRSASFRGEDVQLKVRNQVQWTILILIFLGLLTVWASEIRTFALSLAAFAVALVVATKELTLCLLGAFVRMASGAFSIGDRIEVNGVRGDVVNIGAFTTTVLEVGPGHRRTGRAITIPNAQFLGQTVCNETFTDNFVLHTIKIPVSVTENWQDQEARLLEIARDVCGPFLQDAKAHIDRSAEANGLPVFNVEPTAQLQVVEADQLMFSLRIPTRARERGNVEQDILRRFLSPAEASVSPTQQPQ